jgi:hypothetical protein
MLPPHRPNFVKVEDKVEQDCPRGLSSIPHDARISRQSLFAQKTVLRAEEANL